MSLSPRKIVGGRFRSSDTPRVGMAIALGRNKNLYSPPAEITTPPLIILRYAQDANYTIISITKFLSKE